MVITTTTFLVLALVLLCIGLADFGMSVYIVTRTQRTDETTRQTARTLAAITESTRQELVQHMIVNRVVSEQAAEAASEAFHEANNNKADLARIAQSQATAARAEDDARAEQLQSIATTGEDTNRNVKQVKKTVESRTAIGVPIAEPAESSAAAASAAEESAAAAARQ